MRILITTATYLPSTNGVAFVVEQTRKELIRQGHEVLLLAPQNGDGEKSKNGILYYPAIPNPIIPSEYPVGMPLVSLKKIEEFRPQVIQTHHPVMVGNLSVYMAQKYNLPLFFSFNSDYEQYLKTYLTLGSDLWQKVLVGYLKRFASNVTRVISPSTHIYKHLIAIGIKNSVVIANGIDTKQFRPTKSKPEELGIIFVGRLEKEKQPKKLIDLAVALRKTGIKFKMMIVGTGLLRKDLVQMVKRYNLSVQVELAGRVSRERVARLLSRYHFFVSYSQSETFSLSHLEAQACGVVLLLPPSVMLGDYASKETVVKVPQNFDKAAEKIISVFKDKNKYNRLVSAGLRVSNKYSVERTTSDLVSLFSKYI